MNIAKFDKTKLKRTSKTKQKSVMSFLGRKAHV